MFFALCLQTAVCADAEKLPKGAVTLIYMIGDGLGLAQVSMPVIGGAYVPKAFDRAQGAALIRTRRPTTACRTPLRRDGQHRTGPADHGAARTRQADGTDGDLYRSPNSGCGFFCLFEGLCYLCLRYGFPVPLRSPGIKREYRENR